MHTLGQMESSDTFLSNLSALLPTFDVINLFDGPKNISSAPATPTTTVKPTVQQMMYYNYYTASVNCMYLVDDLSCSYCQKIKGDITKYKGTSTAVIPQWHINHLQIYFQF